MNHCLENEYFWWSSERSAEPLALRAADGLRPWVMALMTLLTMPRAIPSRFRPPHPYLSSRRIVGASFPSHDGRPDPRRVPSRSAMTRQWRGSHLKHSCEPIGQLYSRTGGAEISTAFRLTACSSHAHADPKPIRIGDRNGRLSSLSCRFSDEDERRLRRDTAGCQTCRRGTGSRGREPAACRSSRIRIVYEVSAIPLPESRYARFCRERRSRSRSAAQYRQSARRRPRRTSCKRQTERRILHASQSACSQR
jgi:hypothetical protein